MLRDIPKGIKPCPNKTEAVLRLPSPRTIKEVQSLNGKLASLNRFLSMSAEKAPPNTGFRSQEVTKIFPSALYLCYHRPTHQTNNITPRCSRAITKIERHARRTQYHVPAKDIRKRTDPRDFLIKKPDESPPDTSVVETLQEPWTLFMDGSSCMDGSGAGLILTSRREQILKEKSIQEEEVATMVEEEGLTWMTPIMEYLKDGTLPNDRKEASKLRDYVIREVHEGSSSMHTGPRSVVAKAMQLGYYWPTMHRDARDMIRKCNDCQIHHPVPTNPQQPLTPIMAPWLFYKWGIDIVGPFPEGPRKVKFLIVAIDYFTKWIEAKAMATITGSQVKKFVWDNIVCRFGLLGEIVSDNGKQFSKNPFKDWCENLNITQRFALVKHLQSNGLVERANRSLGEGIKARLGEGNKNWIKEIPHVL
ncbi:reverse transcriptase domain-containing protein [Tanacetum coccineum]